MTCQGRLYVVAAPSGAGKTSLVNALIKAVPQVQLSISHTTRPIRPGEENGVHYFFTTKPEFEALIAQGAFFEHATVFTNYYGTSRTFVEQTLAAGRDVILEIDWQGHEQIKQLFPSSIGIFILPPSMEALRERLTSRKQDSAEVIAARLADAKEAVSHLPSFEYVVMNDDFNTALAELSAILIAERLRTPVQAVRYAHLVEGIKKL
jgi:guanylate kinase